MCNLPWVTWPGTLIDARPVLGGWLSVAGGLPGSAFELAEVVRCAMKVAINAVVSAPSTRPISTTIQSRPVSCCVATKKRMPSTSAAAVRKPKNQLHLLLNVISFALCRSNTCTERQQTVRFGGDRSKLASGRRAGALSVQDLFLGDTDLVEELV